MWHYRKIRHGWALLGVITTAVLTPISTNLFAAEEAEVRVEATIESSITVNALTPTVQIGAVTRENITGTLQFQIESNDEAVSMQVLVTNLYKDDDPNLAYLSVDTVAGVSLLPEAATAINNTDLNMQYTTEEQLNKPKGVYGGHKTGSVELKTTQGDMFIQNVTVSSAWTQDSILPSGSYVGYVVLYVSAVPF